MKKFFAEFKKFITRGNIVDMSVGVIVGGAFTAIVNGLSNNILKPIINWFLAILLGSDSLSGIFTYLKKVEIPELDANGVATGNMVVDLTQSIYIDWGAFINAVINFLIIAFVLFTIVKIINRISDVQKKSNDIKVRIAFKQEKGLRLSKKEKAFLAAEEEAARIAEEERIAQEEAAKNAPKVVTTEELLTEIRDLLRNK
jgi:large conductance mechanosensitive channel